jgi:ribosome-binding protein aMBF1 (putative translation factor)
MSTGKSRRQSGNLSDRKEKTGKQPRSRFSDEYGVLLEQLVEARKAAGMTQVQVARQLGKVQSHVSMCENREREISIIDLYRWCKALGIKFGEFASRFESAIEEKSFR